MSRAFESTPSPATTPSADPGPDRAAARGEQRQPEHRRPDQLVEDLAVPVDVVPDEVGLEGRDHRGEQADPQREEAAADLEHAERGRDRDQDLHRPERPPVEAGDPEDRDQEEAVQRLGVGGRMAGDVAERPVRDDTSGRASFDFSKFWVTPTRSWTSSTIRGSAQTAITTA